MDELDQERRYLRGVENAIEATRRMVADRAGREAAAPAGLSGRVDRDTQVQTAFARLHALDAATGHLCFGRLTMTDSEVRYIGRQGVSGPNGDVLVVDWRAPAALPFYRATPVEPMNVAARRHFRYRGRELVGIDDQLFGMDAPSDRSELVGEAALLAALESPHAGRMAPIVATIQAEQDEVIRSPLAGVLIVAGGPGTGKTVVALHRAAYLLFTHPLQLRSQGILVVGPTRTFLRYVGQVLPDLGEHAVSLVTVDDLPHFGPATTTDTAEAAAVKGRPEMVAVLAQALRSFQRPGRQDVRVPVGRMEVVVTVAQLRRIVARARARGGSHRRGRQIVQHLLASAVAAGYQQRIARDAMRGRPLEGASLDKAIGSSPAFKAALDQIWPVLTPEELLGHLLATPRLLAIAAAGLLDASSQEAIGRPRAHGWSSADLALLDELDALIGRAPQAKRSTAEPDLSETALRAIGEVVPIPECRRCRVEVTPLLSSGRIAAFECDTCGTRYRPTDLLSDEQLNLLDSVVDGVIAGEALGRGDEEVVAAETWGHVIVDEAQDLSHMQWRVIGRRCPTGSMTIVGDVNQTLAPGGIASWEGVRDALGSPGMQVRTLGVNYRTPAPVMDLASRILPGGDTGKSVRDGQPPRFVEVAPADLVDAVTNEVEAWSDNYGTIGVICAPNVLSDLRSILGADDPENPAQRLLVLTPTDAKGLEFDLVVIADPTAIRALDAGARQLYVAVTRATRHVSVVGPEAAALAG